MLDYFGLNKNHIIGRGDLNGLKLPVDIIEAGAYADKKVML
jgi:hypothetical protein